MECEKARDLGFFPNSLAFLMGSPCAPKRKAVGSNPAGEAKKVPKLGAFFYSLFYKNRA